MNDATTSAITPTSEAVRAKLVRLLRRDLIGPDVFPNDDDLATELLTERPSRWYLTGFIAPEQDTAPAKQAEAVEQDLLGEDLDGDAEPEPDPLLGSRSEDNNEPDPGAGGRRIQPTSLGLTVLLRPEVRQIEAVDYLGRLSGRATAVTRGAG